MSISAFSALKGVVIEMNRSNTYNSRKLEAVSARKPSAGVRDLSKWAGRQFGWLLVLYNNTLY